MRETESEIDLPTYEDLDRLFLYALVAMRELSSSVYPVINDPGEWVQEADLGEATMIRAWNRRLGKTMHALK
jgi:hypothetical protein